MRKLTMSDLFYLIDRVEPDRQDVRQRLIEEAEIYRARCEIDGKKTLRMHRNTSGIQEQIILDRLNITADQLAAWEKDNRTMPAEYLPDFAALYGVSLDSFYIGTLEEYTAAIETINGYPLQPLWKQSSDQLPKMSEASLEEHSKRAKKGNLKIFQERMGRNPVDAMEIIKWVERERLKEIPAEIVERWVSEYNALLH